MKLLILGLLMLGTFGAIGGTYIRASDSGVYTLTTNGSGSNATLKVIQNFPPLKQIPAKYSLVEKRAHSTSYGDLELLDGLRGNSFVLGELVSYSYNHNQRSFDICNRMNECFKFWFKDDLY